MTRQWKKESKDKYMRSPPGVAYADQWTRVSHDYVSTGNPETRRCSANRLVSHPFLCSPLELTAMATVINIDDSSDIEILDYTEVKPHSLNKRQTSVP